MSPVQTNTSDCGVWLLAVAAAVFGGYDCAKASEGDIAYFRRFLLGLILSLPVYNPDDM